MSALVGRAGTGTRAVDLLKSASRPLRAAARRARLQSSGLKIGLALAYHRVAERVGTLEHELVPRHDLALFDEQMRHLRAHYRVVTASEFLEAVASRRRGERIPVAITFDDDLSSHIDNAAPVLKRHDLTATFFLCGASAERPFRFWWERLQAACEAGMPVSEVATAPGWDADARPPATLHDAADVIQRVDLDSRAELERWLESRLGPDPEDSGMRAKAIRALCADGFEVGFHTLRHPFLPVLPNEELDRAMIEGREALGRIVGAPLETLAYPHGGYDHRVADAARRAGYRAAFTLEPDRATAHSDALVIGRLETFESGSSFALQLVRRLAEAQR
jgi:peptidoglycan/xylan/chitin deacetylase (PgdA/CDA1 family)